MIILGILILDYLKMKLRMFSFIVITVELRQVENGWLKYYGHFEFSIKSLGSILKTIYLGQFSDFRLKIYVVCPH